MGDLDGWMDGFDRLDWYIGRLFDVGIKLADAMHAWTYHDMAGCDEQMEGSG